MSLPRAPRNVLAKDHSRGESRTLDVSEHSIPCGGASSTCRMSCPLVQSFAAPASGLHMDLTPRRSRTFWRAQLDGDAIPWLLEPEEPGVRYLALRDLMDCPPDDPELRSARRRAHREGPIAAILEQMHPEGWWTKPNAGYSPKYRSTDWSVILLAQLGATLTEDARIAAACTYVLEHAFSPGGQFSVFGSPSGTIDCLQGNLCWALHELGCSDPRLRLAYEWMARSVTGEGVAPSTERNASRRYLGIKCGPGFGCAANNRRPCAWGAVKVMMALSVLPATERTPLIDQAIRQGVEFLLAGDPASASYPTLSGSKPNRSWWKFGFPVFYVTDVLQNVQVLASLGCGAEPRLQAAVRLVRDKQDALGRWSLEYDYAGKTWVDFGARKQPSKWVTLRALRALKTVSQSRP